MKPAKKTFFWIMIFIIGGLGGIVADRYFFPYLSSKEFFSKFQFLKRTSEEVTIINKTEQVFIKEENTVNKVTNKTISSLVEILSYQTNARTGLRESKEGVGTIITSDGLILTSDQNIFENEANYKITLSDGTSFDGGFFGLDSFSNLAFLKINAANLNAASFANSDDIRAGEKIIAFGTNTGKDFFSVSSGLVKLFDNQFNLSGKTISSSEKLEGVYQTDLSFDENFNGGVITDFASQIVGIIDSIEEDGEVRYFAIPSNKVKIIIDRAIQQELESNPALGVYYVPIDKNYALVNELEKEKGALIYTPSQKSSLAILSNSPAQKAGLRLGDIILRVNDQEIDADNPLSDLLYQHRKGEKINLTIFRNQEEITKEVEL